MKRKILVTGGAGNVGGSLARRLVENEDNFVVIIDNLLTGSIDKLPKDDYKNWKFINANVNIISDVSEIMTSFSFDYVYHYAAVVGVQRTLENPRMVLDDIEGIKNILDLSKNTGVTRVFFSSSSEVYGEPVELPQHEQTTPLNSKVPYAVVKNIGESFLRSYHQEFGLEYTIFRFFNTYGPNQSDDFVMSKFLFKAINDEDITIYGEGTQTRTFCYCDDNIDACLNAFYKNKVINDVINIGGEIEVTIIDLAQKIIDATNSKSKIIHLPPLKDGDMLRRCPDNTKMRVLLGRELITIDEGIKKLLDSPQFQK